jgi:aminopeptidase YwaD
MNTRFSGEQAYKHLVKMAAELPHRNSGSNNERKAASYIKKYFESIGLKTWTQSFEVDTGVAVTEKVVLKGEEIQCKALPLAGSTGPEGVEGELYFVQSVVEEYVTPDMEGKILLTQGYYRKGIELLNKYRPLAVINIGRSGSSKLSHGWGTASLREKYGSMPTVNILYEDGLRLLDHVGSTVKVVADIKEEKAESLNIIGELTGSTKPDEIIIIGGHYDSVPDEPGAADNAAGTAIAMELARIYKESGSKRTLRFMAWGSEEIGCKGSEHDVNRLKKEDGSKGDEISELDKVRLVINVDVQGARLGSNTSAAMGPSELAASVKLLAKETGLLINMDGGGGGISNGIYSSDGTSYSAIGIPSLNFIRGGTKGIHSNWDTIEWLHPDGLVTNGVFIERFIERYCNEAVVFPFERKIPEDQQKNLEKYYKGKIQKPPGSE